MSLVIEAPSRNDHAPQTFSLPRPKKDTIRSSEMQPRGILLSSELESGAVNQEGGIRPEINGKIVTTEVFNYRKQRLEEIAGDWKIINDEFPGQFAKPRL